MTGYEIYNRALTEVFPDNPPENTAFSLPETALNTVNDIGSDLIPGFRINGIFDEFDVESGIVPVFTYGVAMMISALYGFDAKNAFFGELYNAKRSAAKSEFAKRKDILPAV